MNKNNLIKIGKVLKVNRKTGELTVAIRPGIEQIPEVLKVVFLEIDGGPVPFFPQDEIIISSDFLKLIIEDYNHPDRAQAFVGADMLIENIPLPAKYNQVYLTDQLIGYHVTDKVYGDVGIVEQVVETSMQYILQIKKNDAEILVPLVDAFILSIDENERTIHLDLPEGLIDLYV